MANDQNPPLSFPASADLSASQFCAVILNGSGKLALPSAGGGILGVLYTKPNADGRAGTVETLRGKKLRAKLGGSVTVGDPLKVDTSGRFLTATGAEVAAGNAVAIAAETGTINQVRAIVLFGNPNTIPQNQVDDIVLSATAPSNLTSVTYVQTTGTQSKALAAGVFVGQRKRFIQSVAAATPVGTITGAFKTLAGAAATTLALGTAVAYIGDFVWDGAAWRLCSALGGTGSSLA